MEKHITEELLEEYEKHLHSQEKSSATIKKYLGDLRKLVEYADGQAFSKELVIAYKEHLKKEKQYKTSSINSFLVAANRFFEYMGWLELRVKTYKVQNKAFVPDNRELTKQEYKKLVEAAVKKGKKRIGMILQTVCATGIRISELASITVEAVKRGLAVTYNKGKERQILISRDLQVRLLDYVRKRKIKDGPVFRTSKGKPVDRTWVWREMKKLCRDAKVDSDKVFPHNLRHLFAREFYSKCKDIVKLADVLGHSCIETTRIYLKETYREHLKQMEQLDLLIDGERHKST